MHVKSMNKLSRYCFWVAVGLLSLILFFSIIYPLENIPAIPKFETFQSFIPGWCPLDINYIEQNLFQMDQKDPQLIQYARARYLTPPSKQPYNLKTVNVQKDDFIQWVTKFFKDKRNGVFLEIGANEGDISSHTLYLEKALGWTGLLVECNPTVVPTLRSKHRKAWIAGACLAPSSSPGILNFSNPTNWTYSGTFKKPRILPVPTRWTHFDVETIPLYTILAAIDMYEIDFFSFDIEGVELSVLKEFPFDLVVFKVMIIEMEFYTNDEKLVLNALLEMNGYIFVRKLIYDRIYIHKSVKHLLPASETLHNFS